MSLNYWAEPSVAPDLDRCECLTAQLVAKSAQKKNSIQTLKAIRTALLIPNKHHHYSREQFCQRLFYLTLVVQATKSCWHVRVGPEMDLLVEG